MFFAVFLNRGSLFVLFNYNGEWSRSEVRDRTDAMDWRRQLRACKLLAGAVTLGRHPSPSSRSHSCNPNPSRRVNSSNVRSHLPFHNGWQPPDRIPQGVGAVTGSEAIMTAGAIKTAERATSEKAIPTAEVGTSSDPTAEAITSSDTTDKVIASSEASTSSEAITTAEVITTVEVVTSSEAINGSEVITSYNVIAANEVITSPDTVVEAITTAKVITGPSTNKGLLSTVAATIQLLIFAIITLYNDLSAIHVTISLPKGWAVIFALLVKLLARGRG
ncbi:uncharacterized protein LY79DRAFT_677809 [Colletotrichum navitas]|uniref:Uncharacterized protein n=1 Tax=Colletotrichum navitas TaxID=681940 RepID=A0AAD8UZS3_9PEZI|nr:uncharacterized protein LY79DRAFT_677809 [Colletotrichum navitas]KAK1570198.1 hypothetical protein LY79DRAFT_677809 [Colletotrichum navitas]